MPQVSLKKPHPLITRLLQADDERRQKIAESSWHWDKPIFDNPMEQRRLRLINRLFWAFVGLGYKPAVLGKDASAFSVTVGDEIVRLTLDPPGTDRTAPLARPARTASDSKILKIQLSWYKPPAEKARREEAERQRKEREKILKREQARRERLFSDAENWNKATLVRQYVHAVLEEPRLSDAAAVANTWAQWALAEADRMDP